LCVALLLFFFLLPRPPRPPPFPYPPLSRSAARDAYCAPLTACGEIENADTCRKANVGFDFRLGGIDFRLTASLAAAIDMHKVVRSEEHTSELQSLTKPDSRLFLEKKKQTIH